MVRKPPKTQIFTLPLLRIGHLTAPEVEKNFGKTAKKSDESVQPFSVRSNSQSPPPPSTLLAKPPPLSVRMLLNPLLITTYSK